MEWYRLRYFFLDALGRVIVCELMRVWDVFPYCEVYKIIRKAMVFFAGERELSGFGT